MKNKGLGWFDRGGDGKPVGSGPRVGDGEYGGSKFGEGDED